MFLIVGLGNPGARYAATRHNIGFDMVTYLGDKYDIPLRGREGRALVGRGVLCGEKVLLAQPQTYMNCSGVSVRALSDYYKIPLENIIVIYDDINFPVGQIRVRAKGSAGGHNGIKSIIEHLGTQEFSRIRIGVGGKPDGADLAGHVLGRFSRGEDALIRDVFALADEALSAMLADGAEAAMNLVNGKRIER